MRFAVIGVGGVGGYFGARLAEAGEEVTFIARGAQRAAIEQSGLHVHSPKGDVVIHPARVTENASSCEAVDCVILGVKAWQVTEAARSASALIGPHTLVLPLQNGVEAPEQVAAVLGREHTLGGVAKIISFLSAPGHIRHAGAEPALIIGALDGRHSEPVAALARSLGAAKAVDVTVSSDITLALWEKFLFITAWAGVGAVTRAPLGVLRSLPETRHLIEASMHEVERLAGARGIQLAPGIVPRTMAFLDSLGADGTASLQRDISAGRPSELDELTGAVVRFGAQAGVATPVSAFLLGALLPLERRARGLVSF